MRQFFLVYLRVRSCASVFSSILASMKLSVTYFSKAIVADVQRAECRAKKFCVMDYQCLL